MFCNIINLFFVTFGQLSTKSSH